MKFDTVETTPISDSKHATIASLSEFKDSNFSEHIMHDAEAIKNARGDNSQVFVKKETSSIHRKVKRKKDSMKKGQKQAREDASLKLVPLHINDVIEALKYVKKSSLTAFMRSCNRMKLEYPDAGKISARFKKFHNYETSEIDDCQHADKESVISDFVEELNIRYVRKCESDIRRSKRVKRRNAVGHHHPKKWSQPLIREMKLSEKNCSRARKQERSIKSDDKSSLTLLTFLPAEHIENQINIEQMRNPRWKIDKHSSKKLQESRSRKREKRHRDTGDFEKYTTLTDASSRKGRKIHSKSYTANKEKDIHCFSSKEKRHRDHTRGMYTSKSQESTYKVASTKRRMLRKNRTQEHGQRERPFHNRKGKIESIQNDSGSSAERFEANMNQKLEKSSNTERLGKEKTTKLNSKELYEEEQLKGNEEKQLKNEFVEKTFPTNDEKTLSGKSLIDFSQKSYQHDYVEKNYRALSNANYDNYLSKGAFQGTLTDNKCAENNYHRIIMSNSDIPDEINKDFENYSAKGSKVSDRIILSTINQSKLGTNLGRNFQVNEVESLSRGSDTNLIKQNSKIIIKIATSQTKMQSTVGNSQYCLMGRQRSSDKIDDYPTDSCSVNIIPSDTCNKRYRKNRLNGNFGILSRISVPDFHQKQVLTSKNFRKPKPNKSKLQQCKESNEKLPSNDPLKNIMLTQMVRQNSSMSLKDETKVDVVKKYILGELSSDAYSYPLNISDIRSSGQTPNLALLSDPFSTYGTETASPTIQSENIEQRAECSSDSSLRESVIIATMSRKQSKTKRFERNKSTAAQQKIHDQQEDESTDNQSSDEGTYYQRSGHICNIHKRTQHKNSNKNQVRCEHHDRNKSHGEKKQDELQQRSNSSNEENPENSRTCNNRDRGERSFKTCTQGKKCAVGSCNKQAVEAIEPTVGQEKKFQGDMNHPHCHPHSLKENSKKDGIKCTHKTELDQVCASSYKTCILCTAPLTDQNTSRDQPFHDSNKHFVTEDNFPLSENLQVDDNVPYFRSLSQEDFQRYISQMQPCFSTLQHPAHPSVLKKYRSLPVTTPVKRTHSQNKYYPQSNYWETETNACTHNIQCKANKTCVNYPFSNRENLVYYCTETGMVDAQQNFDYSDLQATSLNFKPFPFMQSTGPPMDMNGRPVLILDENGQPLLDYDGEPITPDSYAQVEKFQYDPGFRILNSNSVAQNQMNQTRKFSNCFGFH